MKCPKCGKDDHIHRSRRRTGIHRFYSAIFLVRPYRCHHCNTRFWRPIFLQHKHAHSIAARGSKKTGARDEN